MPVVHKLTVCSLFILLHPVEPSSENYKSFWTLRCICALVLSVHWLSVHARMDLCSCLPNIFIQA
jgi:hypothetical protein